MVDNNKHGSNNCTFTEFLLSTRHTSKPCSYILSFYVHNTVGGGGGNVLPTCI